MPAPRLNWFGVYLAVTFLRVAALWVTPGYGYFYGAVYYYSEPILSFLWIAMALELYTRVSAFYRGMSPPGWAAAALVIAIGVMMTTLVEDHSNWQMQSIFLLRRATATVLAFAIGFLAALFAYFRNSLPPNLVRHSAIMAVYFATQAIAFFAMNLLKSNGAWDLLYVWGAVACYIAWAIALTPAGQRQRTGPQGRRLEGVDQRLEELLELAKTAGRSGRKNNRD